MRENDLYQEIKKKWKELNESEEDMFDEWHAYLDEMGLVDSMRMEYNWGEYGVPPVLDELVKMINEERKVLIVDDPSCEGSDTSGFLIFSKNDVR